MDKVKAFCSKLFKNHIVTIFFVSILLMILIETLARHSLIQSISFMISSPLVFACNVAIICAFLLYSSVHFKFIII